MIQEQRLTELFNTLQPDQQNAVIDFIERLAQKRNSDEANATAPDKPFRLVFGCMKGTVIDIAEDFDSPLEDFAEYMS